MLLSAPWLQINCNKSLDIDVHTYTRLRSQTLNSPPAGEPRPVCPAEGRISTDPPTDATVFAGGGSIDQRDERTPARGKVSLRSSSAHSLAPAPRPSTWHEHNTLVLYHSMQRYTCFSLDISELSFVFFMCEFDPVIRFWSFRGRSNRFRSSSIWSSRTWAVPWWTIFTRLWEDLSKDAQNSSPFLACSWSSCAQKKQTPFTSQLSITVMIMTIKYNSIIYSYSCKAVMCRIVWDRILLLLTWRRSMYPSACFRENRGWCCREHRTLVVCREASRRSLSKHAHSSTVCCRSGLRTSICNLRQRKTGWCLVRQHPWHLGGFTQCFWGTVFLF